LGRFPRWALRARAGDEQTVPEARDRTATAQAVSKLDGKMSVKSIHVQGEAAGCQVTAESLEVFIKWAGRQPPKPVLHV